MKHYFPVMLDIEDAKVVVFGGGDVAERKVKSLLECGARVTLIAPRLTSELEKMAADGRISHLERGYRPGDTEGTLLVFAAVDDAEVNAAIARESRETGVPFNIVDQPDLCGFIVPSVVRRGRLAIAVSTGGASPAWARKIREGLEKEFGAEYAMLLDELAAARKRCLSNIKDPARRRKILLSLADDSLLELARSGDRSGLETELARLTALERKDI